MLVARLFSFEAAHRLPDHPGPCRELHGHSYRLRVVCRAPVDPRTGLAIDFGEIRDVVGAEVLDVLDHTLLNDVVPLPSAENLAIWIWERLQAAGLPLHEVELFETARCSVIYRGEGRDDPDG
ncbi:MAG: 6-carboxytetrahydropterin synthase QueD [Planctomycetota bacterium]